MISVGIIGYGFVGKALGQLSLAQQIDLNIYDIGIDEHSNPEKKSLAFGSDMVFLCLPTPSSDDGTLDVSLLMEAAEHWKQVRSPDSILVIKSTIPPGFLAQVESFQVVFNPEFLTQRTAMEDFLEADEVIVGGSSSANCEKVLDLYRMFYGEIYPGKEIRYVSTSGEMAELVKIVRNSYYAVKVSFANEVFEYVSSIDIDYETFRQVFVHQGRNAWVDGAHLVVPGPDGYRGWGGACLPKDSLGLLTCAKQYKQEMPVLRAAIESNDKRRK